MPVFNQAFTGASDGVALTCCAHPRASWYRRPWWRWRYWFPRLDPRSLETIEINIKQPDEETNMPEVPKITEADIEAVIAYEYYALANEAFAHTTSVLGTAGNSLRYPDLALKNLTLCVLVLQNGFTVTGESACVSPENFDGAIGRKIAREHAVAKIWPLLGYRLKEELSAWRAPDGAIPAQPLDY